MTSSRQAALGACVPGRGVTRWRYDPEIESKEGESVKAGRSQKTLRKRRR